MKDLKGFIALDENGRLGIIVNNNLQDKMYYGYSIEIDDHSMNCKMSALLWASRDPHVIDSVAGLKAKASISERAFTKKGVEL